MIDYKLLRNYNIKPKSYIKNKTTTIIETDNNKYAIKDYNQKTDKIYEYLEARNFNFYPKKINIDDKYDAYEFLEDYTITKEEKANELINLVSILHTKTTHYKNVSIDDYKIIYEDIEKNIEYLFLYYTDLNELIEQEIYMAPSKYLLVRNISKIYSLLNYCKDELENWYNLIKDNNKQRVALIHNNLELDHLIRNENSYLISWENSKFDSPIYDLYKLYKKTYNEVDFSVLLNIYEKRYPLKEEELKLFFIMISLPDKIEFINDDYINTLNVNKLLEYIYKTDKFILPYYPKNEKEEHDNLNK